MEVRLFYIGTNVKYAKKSDYNIEADEMRSLLKTYRKEVMEDKESEFHIYGYNCNRTKLWSHGLLEERQNEYNVSYYILTNKAREFCEDIEKRLEYPSLGKVSSELELLRKKSGLSTKNLSEKINLPYSKIRKLEGYTYLTEPNYIYIDDIEEICKFFGTSFNEIVAKIIENENQTNIDNYQLDSPEIIDKTRKILGEINNQSLILYDDIPIEMMKRLDKDKLIENVGVNEIGFRAKLTKNGLDFYNTISNKDSKNQYKILISESPIETKLLKSLISLNDKYDFDIKTQEDFTINNRNYRIDILLDIKHDNTIKQVAIECDGHDYHEKTKEQAQKDKQRDRDFLSIGIPTIRFTGSEIWRNSTKCAEEIFNTYEGYQKSIS